MISDHPTYSVQGFALGERYYSTGRILHSEPATKEDVSASSKFGAQFGHALTELEQLVATIVIVADGPREAVETYLHFLPTPEIFSCQVVLVVISSSLAFALARFFSEGLACICNRRRNPSACKVLLRFNPFILLVTFDAFGLCFVKGTVT